MLRRPDPQAIWPADTDNVKWKDVHGHYHRNSKGGGTWEFKKKIPEENGLYPIRGYLFI